MRYSSAFFVLSAPILSLAAPARFYGKRAAIDVTVLKFADVLEQLESTFYSQALSKFTETDFTSAGYTSSQIPIEQFKSIQADEASHSAVLQAAIKAAGDTPISGCQFNFDSVLTDVATMAATARVVENVGVSAYLGGATLLTDPVTLAAAGSILTIEARHQTILNLLSSSGTAIPAAFDMAFTPSEVLAIASPFISGCDTGLPSNTPLSITNTGSVGPGTLLTFQASSLNSTVSNDNLFCQMLVGNQPMSIPLPLNQCVVPSGINGPVAIFITTDGQPLLNDVHDRANSQTIAGPTLAFIDTQPQSLGQLLRTGSSSSGSGSNAASTSTATISPAQASAIIASASSVSAPAAASTGSSTPTGNGVSVNGVTVNTPSSSSSSDNSSSNPPSSPSGSGISVNTPSSASDSGASPNPTPSASSGTGVSVNTPSTSSSDASSPAPAANGVSQPSNGQPNMFTGTSADGAITVNGWSM